MPVAVFDIDGTLTDTMDVDVECYEAAVLAELEVEIPADWPTFNEVTDSAILATADPGPFVYIGDGVWDGRASMSLGYSFIGVGSGPRGDQLREVGATAVVSDFSDPELLLRHLGDL